MDSRPPGQVEVVPEEVVGWVGPLDLVEAASTIQQHDPACVQRSVGNIASDRQQDYRSIVRTGGGGGLGGGGGGGFGFGGGGAALQSSAHSQVAKHCTLPGSQTFSGHSGHRHSLAPHCGHC